MFAQNMGSFAMARKIKAQSYCYGDGGANCEMSMGAVIARRVGGDRLCFSQDLP
jgi:hypothetical protein